MRIATFALLGLALLIGPAHFPVLDRCPYGTDTTSRELVHAGIRNIFIDILKTAQMDSRNFAICEDLYLRSPYMRKYERGNVKMFVQLIPRHVTRYSADAIRGLIAHDVGHVDTYGEPLSLASEVNADKKAVQWVGTNSVVAGITALLSTYDHFSEEIRGPIVVQYRARMEQLEYRTSSR